MFRERKWKPFKRHQESEEILAKVKFPDWLYWRSGKIKEDSNGVRTFYYRMGRRIVSKVIVPGTLIKKSEDKSA